MLDSVIIDWTDPEGPVQTIVMSEWCDCRPRALAFVMRTSHKGEKDPQGWYFTFECQTCGMTATRVLQFGCRDVLVDRSKIPDAELR